MDLAVVHSCRLHCHNDLLEHEPSLLYEHALTKSGP